MTTVAWDGKTLVADTRCTSECLPYRVTKAWRLPDGRLFGTAGSASTAEAVKEWLGYGGEKPPTQERFTGLLIERAKPAPKIWLMDGSFALYRVEHPAFFAIGSGRDFAIAAMALGKTSKEAVELAAQFDVFTGPPLIELGLLVD